ncbi:MAG: D-aminoacyl-tRNA deacylase [Bryobacteraceae bacterium]
MRAVIQRVTEARVEVNGQVTGSIGRGLVVLLAVFRDDSETEAAYLLDRILGLRIFSDEAGKMNRSLMETGGALLIVSQFTLCADCRKGRRPSFDAAAPPERALALYESFVERARLVGVRVATGVFQAHMMVHLVNDGPVTILLDTAHR